MTMTISLNGLDCANCAAKIEGRVGKLPEVQNAALNFVKQELQITCRDDDRHGILQKVTAIVTEIEPDVTVSDQASDKEPTVSKAALVPKDALLRFGLGVGFFVLGLVTKQLAFYLIAYLWLGWSVLARAFRNILKGDVFDENFLMSVSTIGAFAIGQYPEAVAVMLFYQVGEILQDMAVRRSRGSIEALMNIRPEYANLCDPTEPGRITAVAPESVAVGDTILVKPGEKIPLDGLVMEGESAMDTSSLTGEAIPREVAPGDTVLNGVINLSGVLKIKVTKAYSESTVAKILEMVENAAARKAPAEQFITKFARIYTPVVVFAALALMFLPPLVLGGGLMTWVPRGLVFLVVSCPCALVVSVPLSFFSGIGAASRRGILVKGGNYLQVLSEVRTAVFDKTGTLTEGVFAVDEVVAEDATALLAIAAVLERNSNHPIARSVAAYCDGLALAPYAVSGLTESGGRGVTGTLDNGEIVAAGNRRLMDELGIACPVYSGVGTALYVSQAGVCLGYLVISDRIRQGARVAAGCAERTVMLTGDRREAAERVAAEIGITEVCAELLPGDKVTALERICAEYPAKVLFAGDGINDAPALMRADVGVALGGMDAALEAADVVLMTDDPAKIAEAITTAKATMAVVRQNIIFALGVKAVVLVAAALGFASMWLAVFADVGVTLLVVLNAMRLIVRQK